MPFFRALTHFKYKLKDICLFYAWALPKHKTNKCLFFSYFFKLFYTIMNVRFIKIGIIKEIISS